MCLWIILFLCKKRRWPLEQIYSDILCGPTEGTDIWEWIVKVICDTQGDRHLSTNCDGHLVAVSSENSFQISRPRLPKSKSQHRDRDRDYESCSLSFETETETMNLKVSVTRLRPRPRILVSMSRLTPRVSPITGSFYVLLWAHICLFEAQTNRGHFVSWSKVYSLNLVWTVAKYIVSKRKVN